MADITRKQRVYFGGTYKEEWSPNYTLKIKYSDRPYADAVKTENGWKAVGGDETLCKELSSPDCDSLKLAYFEAAAEVGSVENDYLADELPLYTRPKKLHLGGNPLTAPELLRVLMDDRGFSLEQAYKTVVMYCNDPLNTKTDLEGLEKLQPRTANILKLLAGSEKVYFVVKHDILDPKYRSVTGPLKTGEKLRLAFESVSGEIDRAVLEIYTDSGKTEYPMEKEDSCLYYVDDIVFTEAAALWYCFRLETPQGIRWVCPDKSGLSADVCDINRACFRLTVYLADFETPKWFKKAVMYQIFPDRFAFSNDTTAENGIEYHRSLGQTPDFHALLDDEVKWKARPFEKDYAPDDFFGGTLRGITDKLPYLKELGISCIYLNPIFEARSNHRYDTSDYLKIDPILGNEEDFSLLCETASAMGMHIILDGVFNHTGSDSIYFNRYGHYPSEGACQGEKSPYYKWYTFSSFPDDYECWWGFKDLPDVNEDEPSWQNYVITGEKSVVKTWLKKGASGWRLDVADELPDEALALIRKAVKETDSEAPVIGEVWEDAVVKESYGKKRKYALGYSLDSVMNYPLRDNALSFASGKIAAAQLRNFLLEQKLNYPKPFYYSLMNLLGSHDTDRLLTALSTDVYLRSLSREQQMAMSFTEEARKKAPMLEKMLSVLQFSLPGVPSVYYGDEQGMEGVCDPFNRRPFRLGNEDLHSHYRILAEIRNSNDALSTGEAMFFSHKRDTLIVLRYIENGSDVFGNKAENGCLVSAVNRNRYEQQISLSDRHFAAGKSAEILLGDGKAEIKDGMLSFSIPPVSGMIVKIV